LGRGRRPAEEDAGATQVGAVVRLPLARAALVASGSQVGGYRIERQIGRGGMGVVYRAHHIRLDRPAAVKVLAPELSSNDDFRERFMRESQIAAALQHPNVLAVYDAGEQDGLLYLAMQLIDGSDLRSELEEEDSLTGERSIGVLSQVGAALDAAHTTGLVHRDVKPANILLERDRAFLGDFGLTKRISSSATSTGTGQMVGTVDYVAPEQIEGATLDGRADIYALGCVVYECLGGRPPHSRDSDIAVLFAHLQDQPPLLSEMSDELAPEVDVVVRRAMAKRPEDRYESCAKFIVALADALQVDVPHNLATEPRARVLVASDQASIRAVVRGSLAGLPLAIDELVEGDELVAMAGPQPVDALVVDAELGADEVARLAGAFQTLDGQRPSLLLLVPRGSAAHGMEELRALADAELATPFSGLQLASRLRRLIGEEALRT
jgi:serine/threonine-protein kinase